VQHVASIGPVSVDVFDPVQGLDNRQSWSWGQRHRGRIIAGITGVVVGLAQGARSLRLGWVDYGRPIRRSPCVRRSRDSIADGIKGRDARYVLDSTAEDVCIRDHVFTRKG